MALSFAARAAERAGAWIRRSTKASVPPLSPAVRTLACAPAVGFLLPIYVSSTSTPARFGYGTIHPVMASASCIFCALDREILAESRLSLAIFDDFPVSKGHALIVPKRHVVTIFDMTSDEYADAFGLVRTVKSILAVRLKPDGFNVGANCGEAAGQSVWHAHIHVIPRYTGDVPAPRGGVRNIIPGKGTYQG